jgi:hypothetical protein
MMIIDSDALVPAANSEVTYSSIEVLPMLVAPRIRIGVTSDLTDEYSQAYDVLQDFTSEK